MAGHSKWANIKVRKGSQDAKRSATFTKLSKNILTAIRSGGGVNLELNTKLKTAIDMARDANMPKENIDRLMVNFELKRKILVPMLIEGFAPGGIPVVITCETDNKNRTMTDIKLIFRDAKANMGDAGSVVFMFDHVGEIELEKELSEEEMLEIIDLGVVDIVEKVLYTQSEKLHQVVEKLTQKGIEVVTSGLVYRPKTSTTEYDENVLNFLEELEDNEDVLEVFAGISYE